MITAIFLAAALSAPVPPEFLMFRDSLENCYDNLYLMLYSCPVPSVDHYGAGDNESRFGESQELDDWFLIGDTLITREMDPSMFLFMPESGEDAADVALWLASVQYGNCTVVTVEAVPTPYGYEIPVSLDCPLSTSESDSSLVELLYVVAGDRWQLELPDR